MQPPLVLALRHRSDCSLLHSPLPTRRLQLRFTQDSKLCIGQCLHFRPGVPNLVSVREHTSFFQRDAGWTEDESTDLGAGCWVLILALLLPGCRTSGLLTRVIICPVDM